MKPPRTKRQPIDMHIGSYHVTGTAIFGDWEGDPDVVRGVNELPPRIDDFDVEPTEEPEKPPATSDIELCYDIALERAAEELNRKEGYDVEE